MNFDIIAKDLLKPKVTQTGPLDKTEVFDRLARAGFGHDDIFSELRQLYDNAEDDSTKRQVLDMVLKLHGLYINKETEKSAPIFNFIIKGDNDKLSRMLCPPQLEATA